MNRRATDWRRDRRWNWRASCNFSDSWHWSTGSGSLQDSFNSIYPREKSMMQWCLGSSSFFLIIPVTNSIVTAFAFASRHPGLEIKLHYYTVKCTKAQLCVEDVHMWQCTPDMRTYMIGHGSARSCLWKLATWRFVCRGLTAKTFHCFILLPPLRGGLGLQCDEVLDVLG